MKKLKVLIVDDNRDLCESIKDILEVEGHEALTAFDGHVGVDLAQQHRFDLILMDLVMPGMDGVSAIKSIKQTVPSVPIVVITGFGEEPMIQEALLSGAIEMLRKPLEMDRLLAIIRNQPRD